MKFLVLKLVFSGKLPFPEMRCTSIEESTQAHKTTQVKIYIFKCLSVTSHTDRNTK
jgi:hypothetical protein